MTEQNTLKFFLAANSGEGFINEFTSNFQSDWTAYIIKGGPGTGKSSLMRLFYKKAQDKNLDAVLCPCSSDPDSLDAVILPTKKIIILDGTAPHIVEPKIPGVCEQLINTGSFWNAEILKENKENIEKVMKENKNLHKRASSCIRVAARCYKENLAFYLSALDLNRCFDFAATLCKRYIKGTGSGEKEWVRFLGGITPKGYLFFAETLDSIGKKIILKDSFFTAATLTLSIIRDYALRQNYEIILAKNPILPSEILDAVIIPELDLAFIRETDILFSGEDKRHHLNRFYNKNYLLFSREKMKFNKKAYKGLIDSAAKLLSKAKKSHDELEKYYISAMDYKALNSYFEEFLDNII